MKNKNLIIEEWFNVDAFSSNEVSILKMHRPELIEKYDIDSEKLMTNRFFKLLPYGHINYNTYEISFFEHATDIINCLFSQKVDNDTLVIVSNNEHENVIKNYVQCKNIYILDFDTEIIPCKLDNLYAECSKYKKIFVYVIGTQVSNGIITPQLFFKKLKDWLILNQKEHTITIDDVHGLFIIPRDYTIFDYIVYTCHALITQFDMGILIAKRPSELVGYHYLNWGNAYLNAIEIVFRHLIKFYNFKNIMCQYFEEEIAEKKLTLNTNVAPHIFAPEIHKLNLSKKDFDEIFWELKKYDMRIEGGFDGNGKCDSRLYLRIREGQYFTHPERLIPGLEIVKSIFSTIE